MNREAAGRFVAYAGALLLVMACLFRFAARRPPYFSLPVTMVDHVAPVEHETRGILLLIPQVEPLLPPGAEVTAFRPKNGQAWDDNGVYLTAVGLLPHQSVLPPWSAPEYVIAVGEPFANSSYAPIAGFPNGWLYRRR